MGNMQQTVIPRCAQCGYLRNPKCKCVKTSVPPDKQNHDNVTNCNHYEHSLPEVGCGWCEVERLRKRVADLEAGECRLHCRVRADMWKAGGRYVWDHWEKLARPADCHLDQMYDQWRKHDGKHE